MNFVPEPSPSAWARGVLAVLLVVTLAGRAAAAPDPREIKAREDFVAGRYESALDLFAKLYAETLHPNYLRNVGRCYQNLGQPDRAISSFRDYLRKSKNLKPDERAEIEGYINEMQDLKKQREAAARAEAPAAPAAPAASPPPTPVPAAVPPASVTTVTTAPVAQPPPEESSPLYTRWWFWAAIAGVVGVGVGIAAGAGAFTHTSDASCPTAMGYTCL